MGTVRCYVPLSAHQLEELSTERRVTGPVQACAVTAAVRAADPSGDDEEWEYAALQEAARRQLEAGEAIIIAAVDLAKEGVTRVDKDVSALVSIGDVDLPRVASLHLGDDVVTGERGAVEAGSPIELSWYDTTELNQVLDLAQTLDRS